MRGNDWFRMALCGLVCVSLASGCSRKKTTGLTPDDGLLSGRLVDDGSIPMSGERSEFGTPVEASEFQSENVQFAYDSYQIAPTEISKIERVAEFMKGKGDVKLVADGHCDERGSNEYNMGLGEHRALAVRAYLIRLGVDGGRVQTRSFGEEKPLNSGHDESAWIQNRRVEFNLFR